MIQKLLYKGYKRKVHKGTRGGYYVIYNKKKVYLKTILVKKKTTKKKTTKGKTKSSTRGGGHSWADSSGPLLDFSGSSVLSSDDEDFVMPWH